MFLLTDVFGVFEQCVTAWIHGHVQRTFVPVVNATGDGFYGWFLGHKSHDRPGRQTAPEED